MLSVYNIKPKFQQLLRPALTALHLRGVTPNAITLTAILLSAAAGLIWWFWDSPMTLLVVPFALLIRMALNALDGMMARTYNLQSRLGEVLNEMGDVVSDLLIFFPLVRLPFVHPWLAFIFLLLTVVNEFAGVLSKAVRGERRYDGPMGKSDRALFVGLLCLALFCWPGLQPYINGVLIFVILLLLVSTGTRLRKTLAS